MSIPIIQKDGEIDTQKMQSDLRFAPVKEAESAILLEVEGAEKFVNEVILLNKKDEVMKPYTEALAELIKANQKPVDLKTAQEKEVFLSDAKWDSAESGWAGTPRNRWGAEAQFGQGLFLTIAGKIHPKGLPAHSPAKHVFAVGKKWKRMVATVGLRDGANGRARVFFIVKGDDKELFRSKPLTLGQSETLDIDLEDVQELELITESATKSTHACWAVWGSPKVTR